MARKLARVAAMQLIYERMEGGDGGEETLRDLIGFEPDGQAVSEQEEAAGQEEPAEVPLNTAQEPEKAPALDPEYEEDCRFIQSLAGGVAEHEEELDEKISAYLRGWSLSRVARVDLAILRLAFYELLYLNDAPESVVINEAIEMAKRYSTDRSGAFVNGVLGALSRRDKA